MGVLCTGARVLVRAPIAYANASSQSETKVAVRTARKRLQTARGFGPLFPPVSTTGSCAGASRPLLGPAFIVTGMRRPLCQGRALAFHAGCHASEIRRTKTCFEDIAIVDLRTVGLKPLDTQKKCRQHHHCTHGHSPVRMWQHVQQNVEEAANAHHAPSFTVVPGDAAAGEIRSGGAGNGQCSSWLWVGDLIRPCHRWLSIPFVLG